MDIVNIQNSKYNESPDTNQHYIGHSLSGKKSNDLCDSPGNGNHIFSQTMGQRKNGSSLKKTKMSAPQVVRTPVKGRYTSPSHIQTCEKDEVDQGSDPDARFSSNTTKKYRTKTPRGSIIHSNFKLNQNSLQRSIKHADLSKSLRNSNKPQYAPNMADISNLNPITKRL